MLSEIGGVLATIGPYAGPIVAVLIAIFGWRALRPRYKVKAFLDIEKKIIRVLMENTGKSPCQVRAILALGLDSDVMTPILDVEYNKHLTGEDTVAPQATLEVKMRSRLPFPDEVLVRVRTGRGEETLTPKKLDVGIPFP